MTHDVRVFICGTFYDLKAERRAVLDAAEALKVRYDAMEYFGARDARPLDVCLAEVRECDLLVVIVGHRYGSLVPGQDMSFSEAEYRLAVEIGKPCYVFIASDDVPVPPKETEQDPEKLRKLQAWKKWLSEHHTVAYFSSPTELAVRVVAALTRVLEAQRAVGVNALPSISKADVTELLEEIGELIGAALAVGYTPGVLTGAVRAALAGFAGTREPLGVKVLILSGGRFGATREVIVAAIEKEGADVQVEPLGNTDFAPGQLTHLLESVEVVIVLSSGGPLPETPLLHEIEAAIWRFLLLPDSAEILPISIDGAAVPPLLRAKPQIRVSSDAPSAGMAQIIDALRNYQTKRDSRGARVA
jgi:Domain of unknown function (DUF4062)